MIVEMKLHTWSHDQCTSMYCLFALVVDVLVHDISGLQAALCYWLCVDVLVHVACKC